VKIYDIVPEDAPCRDCEHYDDGKVSDDGEYFHEFGCSGGQCLYCAINADYNCFTKAGEEGRK
jgi:hypothetical protein